MVWRKGVPGSGQALAHAYGRSRVSVSSSTGTTKPNFSTIPPATTVYPESQRTISIKTIIRVQIALNVWIKDEQH